MQTNMPPDVGSLGLPSYHHAPIDTHGPSIYGGLMNSYTASSAFETGSSQSSDGDRGDFSYHTTPPSSISSSHHVQSPYHASHHSTHSLYHSPMDNGYPGFGMGYGRSAQSPVATTHYM
jgi:hypothetical protein